MKFDMRVVLDLIKEKEGGLCGRTHACDQKKKITSTQHCMRMYCPRTCTSAWTAEPTVHAGKKIIIVFWVFLIKRDYEIS